ncbi:MAG: 6-bladed beta-propeller [bacterium]
MKKRTSVRIIRYVLIIVTILYCQLYSQRKDVTILHGKIRHVLTIGTPDTLSESQASYYKIRDIAVSNNEELFLGDGSECYVRVLDAKTGEEIRKFGRKGKGPGEFQDINRLRIESDSRLLVLDSRSKIITLFSRVGKYIMSSILKDDCDDAVLLNDSIF